MWIAALVILGLIVIAAATWGRIYVSTTNSEKRELLRTLEGQVVTIGIGTRFITPQTGRILVENSSFAVTLLDGTARAVPLADIRWIDAADGRRIGGPW